MYVIDEKFGAFGSRARSLFNLGWALLTFFVVPVIVLEDTPGLRTILSESGEAFKETWGESVTASLGISLVALPIAFVGIACFAAAYLSLSGPTAWLVGGFGLVVVVATIVTSQVLGMVARTVLYQYATDDRRVGPFAECNPETASPTE